LLFFQLITVLCICMYGLCPCACVAYDLIQVMLFVVVVNSQVNLVIIVISQDNPLLSLIAKVTILIS